MNVTEKLWYDGLNPSAVQAAASYSAMQEDLETARRRTLLAFRWPWASVARGVLVSLVVTGLIMAAVTQHWPWAWLGLPSVLWMIFWGIAWGVMSMGGKFISGRLVKAHATSVMVQGDPLWTALEAAFAKEHAVGGLSEVLAHESKTAGIEKLIADFVKRRHELEEEPDDLALCADVTAGLVVKKLFATTR